MTYLEYLLTHTYAELPGDVRAEITASDYAARREYAQRLTDKPGLPPLLQEAYRRRLAERRRRPRALPWMAAAAGWLLAITLTALLLTRAPHVEYVTATAAPIVQRDTVYTTLHDTVAQVVYRTRIRRDTFFAPAAPPSMVVVHDTVYRQPRTVYPSGTVSANAASLSLLVGSRGE